MRDMSFLNHKVLRYLVLIPLLFQLANAMYSQRAAHLAAEAMLREKYVDAVEKVDMLAAAVDATPARTWYEHEMNIIGAVTYLDALYQIYGAVYVLADGDLLLITERNFETSIFEPLDYPEFVDAVNANDSGGIIIGYTPEGQAYRELHLYYRWMPLYSSGGERYLVITGVSEHSVVSRTMLLASSWQVVNAILSVLLTAWLVYMIARLGYIYERRRGSKYRDRR